MDEIPPAVTPVFICAAGGRSMRAAQLFVQARNHDAVNLSGGVSMFFCSAFSNQSFPKKTVPPITPTRIIPIPLQRNVKF